MPLANLIEFIDTMNMLLKGINCVMYIPFRNGHINNMHVMNTTPNNGNRNSLSNYFVLSGEVVSFDFVVNTPRDNPLDIYFLMDISASLSDDIAFLRQLSSNLSELQCRQLYFPVLLYL